MDVVYWCLFLFAFFLFARKSNLVPTSKADLKDKKILSRKNVTVHKEFILVSMNWTKAIQLGERILQTPLVKSPGSILCPISAYNVMCMKV